MRSIFGDYQSLAPVLDWMVETVPHISRKQAYQVVCENCAPGRVQIIGVPTHNRPGVPEWALVDNDQPLSGEPRLPEKEEIPISELLCLFPRRDGKLYHVKTRLPWWRDVEVEVTWLKMVWPLCIDDLNQALPAPAVGAETDPSAVAENQRSAPLSPGEGERTIPDEPANRPAGVSSAAWQSYNDANALSPKFWERRGGIANAARAVSTQNKRKFETVRRDIERVRKAQRSPSRTGK